ncbi:MAG TPA: bi-domain-containing oxidoreductase [Kofleriaceae bacterium]|nr:bi-domain-containing oxidoreductase [Kofleriaceae bacterium]
MKQVVQNYRTGALALEDVPSPASRQGGLLVRTVASAVSAGTEKTKVDLARKSLLGKAMARPDQVRQVLDTLKKEGLVNTYNKVRNKLDSLSPLGYSAAGRVLAVGEGCEGFAVGDAVACAGAGYANHAELLWVPSNLCSKIPDGVAFEEAAFSTIGAIALQGVRQAEARFGETIVVIGLGLIGQLTVQLLRASGCRVIGVDVDPWKVELAQQHGIDLALVRSEDVVGQTFRLTDGHGADAVIITAAAPDNDPVVLAGQLARDRAHVVMVGAVPLDVPRTPYYEKELDVRLSRSYGPGRYDRGYEEKGLDYPIGYVRWTENRNMDAFLRALETKQVSLAKLITHRVPLLDVESAYDLVSGMVKERFLGVVLKYPEDGPPPPRVIPTPGVSRTRSTANVSFIGAGSFAGGTLIPILKMLPGVTLSKVCTATGLTARDMAIRHGFMASVGEPADILRDEATNVVFIATRHDSHASLAAEALRSGKAVFVEKPLALTREQLEEVLAAAETNPRLTVGFNRRFSPHTRRVRAALAGAGSMIIHIRVNAGPIPANSWIHDPSVGGGRLLGEVCHFIDLAQAIAGARIRRVYASGIGLPDPASRLRDNVCVNLELTDGSIASIAYTSKGDVSFGKERVEVFGGGVSAVIDDFRTTTVIRNGRPDKLETKQDKGHAEELARFIKMVTADAPPPISLADLRSASLATIAALESLALGAAVEI